MVTSPSWTPEAGLARREAHAVRPDHAGPGDRRAALRAGDLRGPEGLPARRRLGLGLPARRPTRRGSHRSAQRLALPAAAGRGLPRVDRGSWSRPTRPGCRPAARAQPLPAAVHVRLRGRSSASGRLGQVTYCVIAASGRVRTSRRRQAGVDLAVSEDYTRAAPGGTGAAKCGGNYAASLVAQAEAAENGCDQVVFLDAVEQHWVEELGGMNIFFVMRRRHGWSRPSSPARSSRASPAPRSSSSPTTRPRGRASAGSPSTSGARAPPPARSPRSSPAAPPPSSRRSAGSCGTTARPRSPTAEAGPITMRLSARPWSTSSTAEPRTPTAGCTRSSEPLADRPV